MDGDAVDRYLGLLHEAAEIVAQRRQQYGPPAEHFAQVARRWSLTIGTAVRPEHVLLCQLDLKLARLAHDPRHRNSLVDLIGYELMGDASAQRPAEVAELAEPERRAGVAVAEVPLKSAEVKKEHRLT